jgi:hypothetical protein
VGRFEKAQQVLSASAKGQNAHLGFPKHAEASGGPLLPGHPGQNVNRSSGNARAVEAGGVQNDPDSKVDVPDTGRLF